jgi:hypothetical protein
MRLSEFYKIYSGTFVIGLAADEIYSYVRDMRSSKKGTNTENTSLRRTKKQSIPCETLSSGQLCLPRELGEDRRLEGNEEDPPLLTNSVRGRISSRTSNVDLVL